MYKKMNKEKIILPPKSQNLINFEKLVTSREVDFINSLDHEVINKIRNSKSDAEVRRLLKSYLKN